MLHLDVYINVSDGVVDPVARTPLLEPNATLEQLDPFLSGEDKVHGVGKSMFTM